jgi:hypothetical protein
LIGARIELNNVSFIPTVLHVQDGDLTLTRCRVLGPLARLAGVHKTLITLSNSTPRPTTLWMRNNILLSGKALLHLEDNVQLRARNNLLMSLGDGIVYSGARRIDKLVNVLDHNTWAIRQTTFTLATAPDFATRAPILTYASSNAFLNPYSKDADKASLLRGAVAPVTRGQWTWQGQFNIYDPRFRDFFPTLDTFPGGRQPLQEWTETWGSIGEHNAGLLDASALGRTISTDTMTATALLGQVERLTVPSRMRGDPTQSPPGADLVALGLLKKKG